MYDPYTRSGSSEDIGYLTVKVNRVSFGSSTKPTSSPQQKSRSSNTSGCNSKSQSESSPSTSTTFISTSMVTFTVKDSSFHSGNKSHLDEISRRSWVTDPCTVSKKQVKGIPSTVRNLKSQDSEEKQKSPPLRGKLETSKSSNCSNLLTLSSMGISKGPLSSKTGGRSKTGSDKPPKKPTNNINFSNDGTAVRGSYSTDLNILQVHYMILQKFRKSKSIVVLELENRLQIERSKMMKPQNLVERKDSIKIVDQLTIDINKINDSVEEDTYRGQTDELINAYREIGPKPDVISFKSNEVQISKEDFSDEQMKRLMIIGRYLNIASDYIDIDVIKVNNSDNLCQVCGANMDGFSPEEDGLMICPSCGTEFTMLAKSYTYDDEPITPTYPQSNYEDRENFWKALLRYQGKQSNKLPSNLHDILDEHFASLRLPVGLKIRECPMKINGIRGDTGKELMYGALHDVELPQYYEDVNLICHVYWGWKLPDVGHLEDSIMMDYDRSQIVFEQHKGLRKSCLNTQYRVWRHLSRRGHPCKSGDFKIVKTPEIVEFHEFMWKTICQELKWDNPEPLIL